MTGSIAVNRSQWTQVEVAQCKKAIKNELDVKQLELGVHGKLLYILKRVEDLTNYQTPAEGLQLYVTAISALVHYERFGGLNASQIKDLITIAGVTLKVFHIVPQTSTLAFLYGELSMIASQIYLKDGLFWKATWEQYVALYLSGNRDPGGKQYINLLFGIKFLRLGHGKRALGFFEAAESEHESNELWKVARINRIRCLRLTAKIDQAEAVIKETMGLDVSGDLLLELEWETVCCSISRDQNLLPLAKMTRKGGSHFNASYVLEFYLWALAFPTFQWLRKIPKIKTLARNVSLGLKDQTFYYQVARDLERVYDENAMISTRLQILGTILEKMDQCHSVDKQLLILAAICRWLQRNKIKDLAEVILLEYTNLSEKMSQGRTCDLLGVLGDCIPSIRSFMKEV